MSFVSWLCRYVLFKSVRRCTFFVYFPDEFCLQLSLVIKSVGLSVGMYFVSVFFGREAASQ